MIVKNEEDMFGRHLNSVKEAVDEIIIVDTGSEDKTKEVAKQFTDKSYEFRWIDDFAASRNYSFSKATKDYIMWLDADDILRNEDCEKLKKLKETLEEEIDCVNLIYQYSLDKEGKPTLSFRRERLVKRSRNYQWMGFVHEYIAVDGNVLNADICVTHMRKHGNTGRNLKIYRNKMNEGVLFVPRDQYYYAKELYYHGEQEETIEELGKFLLMPSWIEDKLDALYCISDCYIRKMEYETARKYIFKAFEMELPRAEGVYRLAKSFQEQGRIKQAIYWYEQIFTLKKPEGNEGFLYEEYWIWKPHLELCVCYYKMGEMKKAFYHNEEVIKYQSDSESVLYNRKFFKSIGMQKD